MIGLLPLIIKRFILQKLLDEVLDRASRLEIDYSYLIPEDTNDGMKIVQASAEIRKPN